MCYIVIVSQIVYKVVDEKVEGKFTEFHNVGDMADIYISLLENWVESWPKHKVMSKKFYLPHKYTIMCAN